MFRLSTEAVRLLYHAQQPAVRGRLRLDISSTRFPADPTQPLDVKAARAALGERVLRVLKGCATDAVQAGGQQDLFGPDAVPPPPSGHRLGIMPDPHSFRTFVVKRLDAALGLDPDAAEHATALRRLAEEFFTWADQGGEASNTYGVEIDAQKRQAFLRCDPLVPDFPPLDRPGEGVPGPRGG
jgi:hypothetical protein